MFWLRLSGWLFVALLLVTAAVMLLGSRLPATRTTSVTRLIPAPPGVLWPLLADSAAQPRWRPDLTVTSPLPDHGTLPCWTEFRGHLPIPVCVASADAPHHLTLLTVDPRLPFSTERIVTLAPAGPNATTVTLTVTVTTAQPMVRFRERYLRPSTSSPDAELATLAQAAARP